MGINSQTFFWKQYQEWRVFMVQLLSQISDCVLFNESTFVTKKYFCFPKKIKLSPAANQSYHKNKIKNLLDSLKLTITFSNLHVHEECEQSFHPVFFCLDKSKNYKRIGLIEQYLSSQIIT